MALFALHAYDSDDDDLVQLPVQSQDDDALAVSQLVERMIVHVCGPEERREREPVRFFIPDFRASVNDCEISIDSSSSSSSSSWSLSSEDGDLEDEVRVNRAISAPRTKGELELDQLPPIQRLGISAHVEELSHMGRVSTILDRLVTVVSFKHLPPLDLDSILFSKHGTALGPIFDVFGPVKEPRYVLRFNSQQEIEEMAIAADMPIYYAPNLPFTAYVFTSQLMAMRGSDASWKHDNEPPEDQKEYSDDDEERRDKTRAKRKNMHN